MISLDWIKDAQQRIQPHITKTPLTYDQENDLYLKWENHQVTGSFKIRGAYNKILTMEQRERERGLVTASAGNHGQGIAMAGREVKAKVIIFASEHATPTKIDAMRQLGAEVHLVPGGYGEAEQAGKHFARTAGATWISPYNDAYIIAGQGTLGLEIASQLPNLHGTTWIVPAGGGGLISGIGAALGTCLHRSEHESESAALIAVQSEASAFLYSLYHHGAQADVIETSSLADGLAGPVEEGALTITMVQHCVDNFVLVSEDEIGDAIVYAWKKYGERIEGSAATALAAALYGRVTSRPSVVVLSGGNIQPEVFDSLMQSHE